MSRSKSKLSEIVISQAWQDFEVSIVVCEQLCVLVKAKSSKPLGEIAAGVTSAYRASFG